MEGECKVQLDSSVETEAGRETTQNVKLSSKLSTALLVIALCLSATAAAVLVFHRHAKEPGPEEDTFVLHHALRQISNVRAAIHLEGKHNSARTDSVEWKNQVDQSHYQGELKLDDNEIVIPHNGLYFVYSQASFKVNCSFGAEDDHDAASRPLVHLSYTVKRWSKSYGNDDAKRSYQTILHSIRTVCQKIRSSDLDEQGKWYSAIYMGAVFDLKREDRLKTVMEKKNLLEVEDEPGKTFFGVFAL
ncbi:tumor necrosis factor a (TNF superfamily, member 2) [Betta splendens]|uniref:Tumor necrosis factor a (TNF superfamily, member 2) n=1 Tax=Betta splendens TaxID=158456 RepID=A0A6P7NXG7_BETSP|nr:tumor necrosis factor a (TNF superfamily, member 2) [Betta splendens]